MKKSILMIIAAVAICSLFANAQTGTKQQKKGVRYTYDILNAKTGKHSVGHAIDYPPYAQDTIKILDNSNNGLTGKSEINTSFAQVKKDTAAAKPQYDYFIKVPVSVYYGLLNTAHSYRDILIYSPLLQDAEKLNGQAGIDKALFEIRALKVDSVQVMQIKK
jgi:hypothetical protein